MSPLASDSRYYGDPENVARASVASAARTASGESAVFKTEDVDALRATLDVTDATGTSPTLDVKLQTRRNSAGVTGTWRDAPGGVAPQKTAVSKDGVTAVGLDDECKWVWTIAGTTPSLTFSIAAATAER